MTLLSFRRAEMLGEPSIPHDAQGPYFVGLGRAMVSLGPITSQRYCPLRCQFCYVLGPFPRYAAASPAEIVDWLSGRRPEYDIVYVSGDTDSFAEPRTHEGLELLDRLAKLNVDVLFTTRHVFDQDGLTALSKISRTYQGMGRMLIGCVSISQLHFAALEPTPIAPARKRIEQLECFKKMGILPVLTVRPLIPGIPAEEYLEIVRLGHASAKIVLGGDLYLDDQGIIARAIERATGVVPLEVGTEVRSESLDFSLDDTRWTILRHNDAVREIDQLCAKLRLPFFTRSGPGIQWLRQNL